MRAIYHETPWIRVEAYWNPTPYSASNPTGLNVRDMATFRLFCREAAAQQNCSETALMKRLQQYIKGLRYIVGFCVFFLPIARSGRLLLYICLLCLFWCRGALECWVANNKCRYVVVRVCMCARMWFFFVYFWYALLFIVCKGVFSK
jgi:hypothetical protein